MAASIMECRGCTVIVSSSGYPSISIIKAYVQKGSVNTYQNTPQPSREPEEVVKELALIGRSSKCLLLIFPRSSRQHFQGPLQNFE